MKRRVRVFAVLVCILLPPSGAAAQESGCIPPTGRHGLVKEYVDSLLAAGGQYYGALRDSLGLTRTKLSRIRWVTDRATCEAAGRALDARFGVQSTGRPVYVIRVDAAFAVFDTTLRAGEFSVLSFFDRRWRYQSGITF